MSSYFGVKCVDIIKIFNTLSHILYSELTGEDRTTLRRTTGVLSDDLLNKYRIIMGRDTLVRDDVVSDYYKMVIKGDENSSGDVITICFVRGINKVYYYSSRKVFMDDYSILHIIAPDLLINKSDISAADKEYLVEEIFKYILLHFDTKSNNNISSKRDNSKIIVSKGYTDKIAGKLAKLFANLLIIDERVDKRTNDLCNEILNKYTENSSAYLKLKCTTDLQLFLFTEVIDDAYLV